MVFLSPIRPEDFANNPPDFIGPPMDLVRQSKLDALEYQVAKIVNTPNFRSSLDHAGAMARNRDLYIVGAALGALALLVYLR